MHWSYCSIALSHQDDCSTKPAPWSNQVYIKKSYCAVIMSPFPLLYTKQKIFFHKIYWKNYWKSFVRQKTPLWNVEKSSCWWNFTSNCFLLLIVASSGAFLEANGVFQFNYDLVIQGLTWEVSSHAFKCQWSQQNQSHQTCCPKNGINCKCGYCKTSSISCTKSQNLNFSHFILQLSLPYPLQPGVKSRMKM